jgi:DNA-binding beta-propeller fold protein YncE
MRAGTLCLTDPKLKLPADKKTPKGPLLPCSRHSARRRQRNRSRNVWRFIYSTAKNPGPTSKNNMKPVALRSLLSAAAAACLIATAHAADSGPAQPYRLLQSVKVGGLGGWDYVYADSDARRLYIPRGDRITVYDLDTLASVGTIPQVNSVHGVAVDPASHHGFSSSRPLVMWDTATLTPIKTIEVQGGPDGILFEPATERIYILSHRDPNVTVVDAQSGAIVGTIDLGGAPEQAASDGAGHVYIDIEDKDNVAVVDAHTLKVTAHYDLAGKGGGPGALALDAKNHILFAFCHEPAVAVILDARDGHFLATLPIGQGVDAAEFNPATGEAFSSQGDGTLTVIAEDSPTQFRVEQTVSTKSGARTSTLDAKTGRILLISADRVSTPPATAPANPAPAAPGGTPTPAPRRGRAQMVPGSFTILVVGK